MTKLAWDAPEARVYETGVDHGVLYIPDGGGAYDTGFAWNGLTTITEKPTGADATPLYADNIKYLNLIAAEQFEGTIEAYTYPNEFAQCDGTAFLSAGVAIGQQNRKTFGLSYRTKIGDALVGTDKGYKLHLVYGAVAKPSERAHATVNDTPDALAFSWDITTTPVDVPGFKPSATVTIDSTAVDATALAALEDILYGTVGQDPRLPLPAEIGAIFSGTLTEVAPVAPSYNAGTHVLTIPSVTGVIYKIDGVIKTGTVTITTDTLVTATPAAGYKFPAVTDDDWYFDFV